MKQLNRRIRKSALNQFLLVLCLILCLILILNLLLYNSRVRQLYSERLMEDNAATARQISQQYGASMDSMMTACWNMVYNNRELIRIVESYDNSYEHKTALMANLSAMLPVNEYFSSVYLYIPEQNLVVSTDLGVMSFDRFFDREPIAEMLVQDGNKGLHTIYSRFNPNLLSGQNISSILMRVPASYGKSRGFIVVNINFPRLVSEELIRKYCAAGGTDLSIFNTESTRLWGDADPLTQGSGTFLIDKRVATQWIDEASGLAFLLERDTPSLSLAGSDLRYAMLVGLMFFLALGALVAAFVRLFRPLRRILASVLSSSCEASGQEFEALDHYIGRMTKENESLKQHLDEAMPIYRNYLLTELLTLPDWDLDVMLEKLRHVGVTLKLEHYVVMTLQPIYPEYSESEKWDFKLKTIAVLCRLLSGPDTGFYADTQKESVSIALHLPQKLDDDAKMEHASDFAEMLYREIQEATGVKTHIGLGSIVPNLQNLYRSYADSVSALNFVTTIDSPILNIYQLRRAVGSTFEYPYEKERRFTHFVSLGLCEESLQALHCLFDGLRRYTHLSRNEITFISFQLLSALYRVIYENKLDISRFPFSKAAGPLLEGAIGLDQMEEEIAGLACKIIDSAEQQNTAWDGTKEQEVIRYINEHFTENLQMVDLTDRFGYNRFYLSQMIKERTGYAFNDYVNRRKVELAKELLVDPQLSIKEIAERTGFSYSYYFSKIFKKYENISPGEFREKCAAQAFEKQT